MEVQKSMSMTKSQPVLLPPASDDHVPKKKDMHKLKQQKKKELQRNLQDDFQSEGFTKGLFPLSPTLEETSDQSKRGREKTDLNKQ